MNSHREIEKIPFNFFGEEVPKDIRIAILEKIYELKDFLTLRQVCHALHDLTSKSPLRQGYFGFFSHYQANHLLNQFILSPDKITSWDVRAGNLLVRQAIGEFCIGNTDGGEILLRKAIFRYGSYHAMECIHLYLSLRDKCNLNFGIYRVIAHYREKANQVLQNKYRSHFFTADNQHKCRIDLWVAVEDYMREINAFLDIMKEFYKSDQRISDVNSVHFKHKMSCSLAKSEDYIYGIGWLRRSRFYFPEFDATGFLGSALPRDENCWYLSISENQKRFLKRESEIDLLLNSIPTKPLCTNDNTQIDRRLSIGK